MKRFLIVVLAPFVTAGPVCVCALVPWANGVSLRQEGQKDKIESDRQAVTSDDWSPPAVYLQGGPAFDAEGKPLTDADVAAISNLKQLTRLELSGTKITDAALAHVRQMPRLSLLELNDTAITDAGLAHLEVAHNLEVLSISGTRITDAGLVHIRSLPILWIVSLSKTQVGDAGLAHMQTMHRLERLNLNYTRITDEGMASLNQLQRLRFLDLKGTQITDSGLARLRQLERLGDLDLSETPVTGAGFSDLDRLIRLTHLDMTNTRLDDNGMSRLGALSSLVILSIDGTRVTDASIDALRRKLPRLSVLAKGLNFDGASFEKVYSDLLLEAGWGVRDKSAPNGMLHEWSYSGVREPSLRTIPPLLDAALQNDTREAVNVADIHLSDDVRDRLSRLRKVLWLRMPTETTARDLAWIGQLTQLRGLSLHGAKLDGADFSLLKDLQALQWLDLAFADMPGRDFASFPKLERLQSLFLRGTNVTDQHIRHLAALRMPALATLCLEATSVSDAGFMQFCSNYNLEALNLYRSEGITGKSVDAIGHMTHLRSLGIGLTGLSPECDMTPDVARLRKLLPKCSVDYGD